KRRHHGLQPGLVLVGKAVERRAVDIEHAHQPAVLDERDNDFRIRRRIARDVARERVHVRHDDGFALDGRRAAHAAAERDAGAGRLALERADEEVFAIARFRGHGEVKAGPVQVGERVVDERRELRRVGGEVALALEDAGDLAYQQVVVGAGAAFGIDVHGGHAALSKTRILRQ
ncbi:conserved hypothetical protein, partial [Ricinus communis]